MVSSLAADIMESTQRLMNKQQAQVAIQPKKELESTSKLDASPSPDMLLTLSRKSIEDGSSCSHQRIIAAICPRMQIFFSSQCVQALEFANDVPKFSSYRPSKKNAIGLFDLPPENHLEILKLLPAVGCACFGLTFKALYPFFWFLCPNTSLCIITDDKIWKRHGDFLRGSRKVMLHGILRNWMRPLILSVETNKAAFPNCGKMFWQFNYAITSSWERNGMKN